MRNTPSIVESDLHVQELEDQATTDNDHEEPMRRPSDPDLSGAVLADLNRLLGSSSKGSPELRFSHFMARNPSFRSSQRGESLYLYQWEQSHWEKSSDTAGHRLAWNWLKANFPKEATARKAASLLETSLLDLPPVNAGQEPPLFAGEVAVLMRCRLSRPVPACSSWF